MKRAFLLLGLFFLSSAAMAEDWPIYRGPDHNGISKESSWTSAWSGDGPKKLWQAKVGTGFSSVSVADGRVYTMGNASDTDTVYCFEAKTGKELWKHSYKEPIDPKYYEGGPSITPTVETGKVYALSRRGNLFCFNAADGKILWNKNIAKELDAKIPEWGFAGSPLPHGDLLILNVGSYGAAVNKATGKLVWSTGNDAAGYSTPLPTTHNGQKAIAIFAAESVAFISADQGKKLWEHKWKTSYDVNAADPIIFDGKVFISSGYNRGGAVIDTKTSKVLWEEKTMRNHFNSSVLWNGYLYGVDGNSDKAHLRCVDPKDGSLKWEDKTKGYGAVMVANGKLIAIGDKGELVVAEATPTAFKPTGRAQVIGGKCWTVPVLANGQIYVRNARGDLVCVDVKK